MINSNELRKGNIVNFTGNGQNNPCPVLAILEKEIVVQYKGHPMTLVCEGDSVESFPLTPEILKKWDGMEEFKIRGVTTMEEDPDPANKNKFTYWWEMKIPKGDVSDLRILALVQFGKGTDIIWKDQRVSVVVKYVHQLQNLYFALTGQEIKKPPVRC
jgi:hypothetical protein